MDEHGSVALFPQRPGAPICEFYQRTGHCRCVRFVCCLRPSAACAGVHQECAPDAAKLQYALLRLSRPWPQVWQELPVPPPARVRGAPQPAGPAAAAPRADLLLLRAHRAVQVWADVPRGATRLQSVYDFALTIKWSTCDPTSARREPDGFRGCAACVARPALLLLAAGAHHHLVRGALHAAPTIPGPLHHHRVLRAPGSVGAAAATAAAGHRPRRCPLKATLLDGGLACWPAEGALLNPLRRSKWGMGTQEARARRADPRSRRRGLTLLLKC